MREIVRSNLGQRPIVRRVQPIIVSRPINTGFAIYTESPRQFCANAQARDMAHRDGVDIRYYSIIYTVVDDVKKALEGMLTPELREKILGYAQIRSVFNITGVGKVAGCMITEGMVKRGAKIRLLRDNVVIHDGNLGQLKRYKDDVKEVKEGYECGMSFENYNDIQVNDSIECYEVEEIAKTL